MSWDLTQDGADETVDSSVYGATEQTTQRAHHARLVCAYPSDLTAVFDLGRGSLKLGRRPEDPTSPPLTHPTVSRAHFEIDWDVRRKMHVGRDLGSRNGAAIDGVRNQGQWGLLRHGSVVRIGDLQFVYEQIHTLDRPRVPDVDEDNVPGHSAPIRALRTSLARAAPDVSPVLVIGETGTGKERIAAEIHRLSGRQGQLVAINCATLGEQLIESQLFGHVKGAFTGATTDSEGLFRAAEGGTLFLDEIGEMPLELQPKLLRAIQEKEVRAVGSSTTKRVDVRVVAATHRDLADRARAGSFRQDLYARLALWQLEVPALRERRADILAWVDRLHRLWAEERGIAEAAPRFDADAAETLLLCEWPENLRGLNRFVHEVATGERREVIRRADLPSWVLEDVQR